MGGFMLYKRQEPRGVLSATRLKELYDAGEIELPQVTEKEIWDRSKADGLSKTIVLGQTTWFIAQCIARKVQNLGITELELVTVAFAFLNAFMYILWWNKPLNAQSHIPVFLLDEPRIKVETTDVETMEDEETSVSEGKFVPSDYHPTNVFELITFSCRKNWNTRSDIGISSYSLEIRDLANSKIRRMDTRDYQRKWNFLGSLRRSSYTCACVGTFDLPPWRHGPQSH